MKLSVTLLPLVAVRQNCIRCDGYFFLEALKVVSACQLRCFHFHTFMLQTKRGGGGRLILDLQLQSKRFNVIIHLLQKMLSLKTSSVPGL